MTATPPRVFSPSVCNFEEPSDLPASYEDNALADLRPTGVSNDRHTCVAQAL